jgi:tetratricopeptide (TPR) repeat protein
VQDVDYWLALSQQQYRQARYHASIASARKALAQNPNSAAAYSNIGTAYGTLGMYDLAIDNLNYARRLRPSLTIDDNLRRFTEMRRAAPKDEHGVR